MPRPKAKALPFGGVDPASLQYLWVDHAGAEDFHPIIALAHFERAIDPRTAHIDLCRRLGEGEMGRAEAELDLVDLEKGAAELFQHPFEISHGDIAINRQPFDLVEHWRVGLVVIGAIDAAWRNHPDGRALILASRGSAQARCAVRST